MNFEVEEALIFTNFFSIEFLNLLVACRGMHNRN